MDIAMIMNWRDIHNNTMLHTVARSGTKTRLKYLLSNKIFELEMRNMRLETPLLSASYSHPDHVRLLLKYGANVHVVDNRGESPLHRAIFAKNETSVNLILDAGANISLVDNLGRSPLYCAAKLNMYNIVKILLERGAEVNQVSGERKSILSKAVQTNNEALVRLLLQHGALVNHINPDLSSPLHLAVLHDDTTISRLLIQMGADVNYQAHHGSSAMHEAVKADKIDQVKLLVESKANIFIRKTTNGKTPLHAAARSNKPRSLDIIRYLVSQGGDVNDPDRRGETTIHLAAKHCSLKIFQNLLELGADINICNSSQDTILHFAAQNKNINVMKEVLNLTKLKLDVRNRSGCTPLHYAAQNGNIDGCEFLLSEGVDINEMTNNFQTPLHLAILGGKIDMIKFFLRQEAQIHEGLLKAYNDEGYEEINLILLRHVVRKNFGIDAASRKWKYDPDDVEQLEEYSEQCARELESMRNFQIYDNVTMLDITTASSEKLAGYVRNNDLVMAFTQRSNATLFPIYSEDTDARIIDEWIRQRILQDASTVLSRIILRSNDSRHLVLEVIMNYLNFNDLIRIAAEINNPEIVDEASRDVPNTENN